MRLNRFNWQEGESANRYELAWSPEFPLPNADRNLSDVSGYGDIKHFWSSGGSRVARIERLGRSVVVIGGFTGLEMPRQFESSGIPDWFHDADEYQVMLANPFSEELKREMFYKAENPRAIADMLHAEVQEAIGFFRRLVDDGRRLRLRFYNGVTGLSQWMFDSIESIAAVRNWSSRFDLAWADSKVGEFDFDSHELVFRGEGGKVTRRLNFARPPKLPYFDDDGALVISF